MTKFIMKMNFSRKFSSGFTLIELLVVVAIIGILASVVLASLNSARNKGADAAVKADMANIRAQAEIYYDDTTKGNGKYAAADMGSSNCSQANSIFVDPVIAAALTQINTQSSAPVCFVGSSGQKWAISVPSLKGGSAGGWCVDNSGWVKAGTAGSAGTCS